LLDSLIKHLRSIFISHASTDRTVAESLAARLAGPDVMTFLASRPGDIRADAQWLPSIQTALREATAYVILLTPNSVVRPWVNFEFGAAWSSGKTYVLVRAGGLAAEEIPLPLSSQQIYSLEDAGELKAVLHALGVTSAVDIDAMVSDVRSLVRQWQLAGVGEPAWEGVDVDGNFYAWAGPLLPLQDRAAVPCPPSLPDVLRQRGLIVRFGNRGHMTHHFSRGRAQVFATDRANWRRPVESNGQVLLVGRHEDTAS
jgi:hypothetical protein